jgi:outer membrane receptor protein involved in Fe transport
VSQLKRFCGLLLFLAVGAGCAVAQTIEVRGTVQDSTGAFIGQASVTLRSGAFTTATTSDERGHFVVSNVPGASGTLTVECKGFTTVTTPWKAASPSGIDLEIVLRPASSPERIVVSATRAELPLSEAPGSTVLLSHADLSSIPTLALDDSLRMIPGFNLFRRSGSRVANPTAEGVSLRGLGASGASRALVLEDGIPMLDPFGGWMQWDRIPPMELASVEVFRGGASSLYGSDAMGGVIQFITRESSQPAVSVETSYGNERTPNFSAWTGTTAGPWTLSAAADLFRTDGFILVPLDERGTIDVAAHSEHATVDLEAGHQLGERGRVFLRGNLFAESRGNGTPLEVNDTQLGQGALGLDQQFGASDSLTARLYGDVQNYDQSFSSIAANRMSESLTDWQTVPAQQLGEAAQWTHVLGRDQTLVAGTDLVEVIGVSDERLFSSGVHTFNDSAGGRQRTLGIFGEDIFRIRQSWTVIAGLRFDHWGNFDASSIRIPVSTAVPETVTAFPDRTATAFSPRLSLLHALNNHFSVTGSAYRAFRAPTLNELYRNFRQGSIVTLSNPALRSEQLTGAEAGLSAFAWGRRLEQRSTFFWSDIVDPVESVTLTPPGATLITRERQNLGRTRSRGVELDGIAHVNDRLQISAGYAFTGATVVSFTPTTDNPTLVGLDVPQVPRQQFTWEVRYSSPSRWLMSLSGRYTGIQYDDDQNQYPLNRYYQMDWMAGRSLGHGTRIYAAIENLTDQRAEVERTPITNLGPPILFRLGFRYDSSAAGR